MKTKSMIKCAVFAAIMCILCVITVPIGIVPVSAATLAVMLISVILGAKKGVISVIIYILLGAVGLPVYSGFRGGLQVLIGPTGGYIWSYIFIAFISGYVSSKYPQNKLLIFISCIVGIILCYLTGTVQFSVVQNTSFIASLSVCVFPFIPFDVIKAVIAVTLGTAIRNRLIKARLI